MTHTLEMRSRSAGREHEARQAAAAQVVQFALEKPGARIGIAAATYAIARNVLVPYVLKAAGAAGVGVRYEPSRRQFKFENGSFAFLFSSQQPDQVRGVELQATWVDDLYAGGNEPVRNVHWRENDKGEKVKELGEVTLRENLWYATSRSARAGSLRYFHS